MSTLTEDFPPPPFEGFPPEAFTFFRELTENQDRTWFMDHKTIYERGVLGPLASLLADLSRRLADAEIPLRGDTSRSVFRINRDIRFSKDKRPYKTHAGVVLTPDGDKASAGVLYIHVDPAGSFMAAGFFRPQPKMLQALRTGLVERPRAWAAMEEAMAEHALRLDRSEALRRPPKGFESAPAALAEALKLKSWIVRRDVPLTVMQEAGLVDRLVDFAEAASPLLRFGWSALDRHGAALRLPGSSRR